MAYSLWDLNPLNPFNKLSELGSDIVRHVQTYYFPQSIGSPVGTQLYVPPISAYIQNPLPPAPTITVETKPPEQFVAEITKPAADAVEDAKKTVLFAFLGIAFLLLVMRR